MTKFGSAKFVLTNFEIFYLSQSTLALFVWYIIIACLLNRLWSINENENRKHDELDNVVCKYAHGFKYKLNDADIYPVIDMVMNLNFAQQLFSISRKFKIHIIPTTTHISSLFNLHLNPCTYSEMKLSDLFYTEFSIPSDWRNLSKSTELSCIDLII